MARRRKAGEIAIGAIMIGAGLFGWLFARRLSVGMPGIDEWFLLIGGAGIVVLTIGLVNKPTRPVDVAPPTIERTTTALTSKPAPPVKATPALSPACPQCRAPTQWVAEHERFFCSKCDAYLAT